MIILQELQILLTTTQNRSDFLNCFNKSDFFDKKFKFLKCPFQSNKTKFINELKEFSRNYNFEYVTSKVFYDENIPETAFIIKPTKIFNQEDEDYYYDIIIEHMAEFCKINNMNQFFLDSYIILE